MVANEGLMFGDGSLSFHEFATGEPLPLARVHDAVLAFLRGRDDVVLDGSQAVNAYVDESRMTQDVDVLAPRSRFVAEEIRRHLAEEFQIDVRVKGFGAGLDFRVFQQRESGNRLFADVRFAEPLPSAERIAGVLVLRPAELIARKLITRASRRGTAKSWTDWRDLAVLVLRFPDLKAGTGEVAGSLRALGAVPDVHQDWTEFVRQDIQPEGDDEKFG